MGNVQHPMTTQSARGARPRGGDPARVPRGVVRRSRSARRASAGCGSPTRSRRATRTSSSPATTRCATSRRSSGGATRSSARSRTSPSSRAGKIEYLGTAIVEPTEAAGHGMQRDDEVERAAMEHVHGVGARAGLGADRRLEAARRLRLRHPQRRARRTSTAARRCAGSRSRGAPATNLPVELTPNEWVQAGRHRDTFWLYVVWNAKTEPRAAARSGSRARRCGTTSRSSKVVNGYRVPADAIARAAQ